MFAGSASGVLLPPYIVYKAKDVYETWKENGLQGAVYDATPTGWFNMPIFEKWFFSIAVPYFRRLDGPKVLIGDNLCSHISPAVISKCEDLNIRFVLLPPNSTGLCQPLDVAVFRGMKIKWRQVLDEWKRKNYGPLQKSVFPGLLKSAVENIQSISDNLKSGFRAAGIFPLNPLEVIKRLPGDKVGDDIASGEGELVEKWSEAFTSVLTESR